MDKSLRIDYNILENRKISYTNNSVNLRRLVQGFLEWVMVILAIEFTGGVFFLIENSLAYQYSNILRMLLSVAVLLWSLPNFKRRIRISGKVGIAFVCMLFAMLFTLPGSYWNLIFTVIRVYLPLICGILIMLTADENALHRLMKKFVLVMAVIAVISLFFWGMASLLHLVQRSGRIQFDWDIIRGANNYYNLYYEPDWQSAFLFGRMSYKNCGIFTEPPMYGFLLCLAYFFSRMLKEKTRLTFGINVVFIVAIVTTMSVTAILGIMIFESIIFAFYRTKGGILSIVKSVGFIIFILVVVYIGLSLITDKISSSSGNIRSDHLKVSLDLFASHFVTGVGFGNSDAFEVLERYKQGMSIGMPAIWAQGGVGAFFITLFPILMMMADAIKKKRSDIFAFAIAFAWLLACTSVFTGTPITWLILPSLCRGVKKNN